MKKLILFLFLCLDSSFYGFGASSAIHSILTPYTISYVRSAQISGQDYIVASGYDGEVLLINYDGDIIWQNTLFGYFNHDVECYDIDKDGNDEILVASADGALYCIDDNGELFWTFKANDVPLYSVTALELDNGERVAVCGGNDTNFYVVKINDGALLNKIDSRPYSVINGWGSDLSAEEKVKMQSVNFLRRVKDSDGSDLLAVHGVVYANSTGGAVYLLKLNNDGEIEVKMASKDESIVGNLSVGSMLAVSDGAGAEDILLGQSGVKTELLLMHINTQNQSMQAISIDEQFSSLFDSTQGYRIVQAELIPNSQSSASNYFILFGTHMFILERDKVIRGEKFSALKGVNYAVAKYSFNDMCKGRDNKIILASAQSGGSSIHILDPYHQDWAVEIEALTPKGNITRILESSANLRDGIDKFSRPTWEQSQTVYLMSEDLEGKYESEAISKGYKSPIFLGNVYTGKVQDPATWRRDTMSNATYRDKRDERFTYTATQEQAIDRLADCYNEYGGSYWGGHGNDPYFYPFDTIEKLLERTEAKGKQSVIVYPEVHDTSSDFNYVMQTHFLRMANHFQQNRIDAKLFLRSKDIFWLSTIYLDVWKSVVSGQYKDVFIPSMEETSSRTMDLSLAGRVGVWASDCVMSWGARLARDNASHDRLRQDSHQMLPNHFLRQMVYSASLGAQYMDNIEVDQEYMSLFWDMLGRGVIYVPRKDQLLSISPFHLKMREPNQDFLAEGTLGKWTILYDEQTNNSANNPMVFDRMNATWIAGVVPEWDFSSYAAGVKDRRLSFLPSYSNGLVMITPSEGSTAYRTNVAENLHPIYRNIMQSVETDGKYYYDGGVKDAKSHCPKIKEIIEQKAKLLPVTVSGEDVAWVAAQSDERHIRLTLIDGGYISPADRVARVKFNTISPVSITDLLTGEKYLLNSANEVDIPISAGLFRFLDIELAEPLK